MTYRKSLFAVPNSVNGSPKLRRRRCNQAGHHKAHAWFFALGGWWCDGR